MSRQSPTTRTRYSVFRTLQTRWQDVDIYGHVNNVVYFSYFDTAINGWYLDENMLTMGQSDKVFLVVENQAQFFSEIRFPDEVHAGIGVTRLGSSSVTYEIALFTNDSEMACALGRYTHVLVDEDNRKPTKIEGHAKTRLETIQLDI